MSFPYIFESNFELGTSGDWDSETDTVSQLDFPHYSELARFPWHTAAPVNGAYCMRATLSGGTADAFVTEGDINIAADGVSYFKFDIWFSPTFDATADDTVNILELQETGNAAMVTFGFRYVAATDVINFGIGKAAPTSFTASAYETGVWYTVELAVTLDDGGTNDGTIDLYVARTGQKGSASVAATQVASLDQTAVTHGVFGIQGHLATTTGTILFDNFYQDEARLWPVLERFPQTVLLTKSAHVFVGNGIIREVKLLSGGAADNILSLYDTDTAYTTVPSNIVTELKNGVAAETVRNDTESQVHRGAYVAISGTNPRALVTMKAAPHYSVATMRQHGLRRTRS